MSPSALNTVVADVLIIGGGHAGLSAALTLYRALLHCVIFDNDSPRNAWNTGVHLIPTWENKPLKEFRKESREELANSGFVDFADVTVKSLSESPDGLFCVTDEHGNEWCGRKVLLAIGCSLEFPQIKGYEENFAHNIYPCMYQFGFERRGSASAGLLAVDGLANDFHAFALSEDGRRFSDRFTIYTNGNTALAKQLGATAQKAGMHIDVRRIDELSTTKDRDAIVVKFADGQIVEESFLVHRPNTALRSPLVKQLDLDLSPQGDVAVQLPFCKASRPGVFAAGDCASMMKSIPNGISMGAYAGVGIARELPKTATADVAAHDVRRRC